MQNTNKQPISNVEWVDAESLSCNDWNPNQQAPPEHRLLALSLIENGWTQPIVVREHEGRLEIVDGFHRWKIAKASNEVNALTGGLVPIVKLDECSDALAKLATVRHNSARGTHHVRGMSNVIALLIEDGLSQKEIGKRLQLDEEEIHRLADTGGMMRAGGRDAYGQGWAPIAD